jgi:hypothetical protein
VLLDSRDRDIRKFEKRSYKEISFKENKVENFKLPKALVENPLIKDNHTDKD